MTINVLMSIFLYLATFQFNTADESYAVSGSTVQLRCPDKSNSQTWIMWSKRVGNTFISYADATYIDTNLDADLRSRLQITGDQTSGEYHLNISEVRKSDEGMYRCTLSGTSGEGYTQQLTVIIGPTSVYIENEVQDSKIPGIEGQDMTIKCTAIGGNPPPDVKLIILGSNYAGVGSAQYTFKPHSSDDASTVTCQAGYNQINFNPLSTLAYIHLMFKPVITAFDPETLSTDESKLFVLSCKSTGSRPAAFIHWFLGQQNITSNSTSKTDEESSTDKFSVTSNLRYRVKRSYNRQKLLCRASNVAGYMETSLTLNVKYAPYVTVANKTFSQSQTPRQIQSTLNSNPQVNICKWHHLSKYGEYIRDFIDNNLVLTLPTVPEDKRYQDTGEYICTAENGITGMNGQLQQTGSGYVISNASPVITIDNNSTQYGKFGNSTELKVNVYSFPKYSRISWYLGNTQLVSNKYAIKEEPAMVKDVFHGVEVELDGDRVTLTISDLQEADFTNYTLRLMYSGSQYVQHKVTLESTSAPETPSNFNITSSSETSITVQWTPGYDGGQKQTFYVQYRTSGTNTWMIQKITTINQLDIHNFYTLSGLQEKTTYEIRMYSQNAFNQSPKTDTAFTTTLQSVFKEAQTSSNAITGAVAGVVVVLLTVCAIIISIIMFIKRKGMTQTKKDTGFYENSGFKNIQIGDEYEVVVSKSDTQQNQTSKTYESLGTKNAVDVYDDMDNRKGLPSSKPPVDHYEALSAKDKPNFYEELENRQVQTEKVYVNEAF